jgi:hypothetical protein
MLLNDKKKKKSICNVTFEKAHHFLVQAQLIGDQKHIECYIPPQATCIIKHDNALKRSQQRKATTIPTKAQ